MRPEELVNQIKTRLGKFLPAKRQVSLSMPTEGETLPPVPEPEKAAKLFKLKAFVKSRKGLFLGLALVVATLLILLFVLALNGKGVRLPEILPPSESPSPTPSPVEVVRPSAYAEDEDVKKIEAAIAEHELRIRDESFRDDTLRVPVLDWNVSF